MLLSLLNDLHNLRSRPQSRLKKWNQQFEHLKSSLIATDEIKNNLHLSDKMILFSIVSALVILNPYASPSENLLLRTQLFMYFDLALNNQQDDRDRWLRPLISDSKSHFYPYFVEYICHIECPRPQISENEFYLIMAQIDWFLLRMLKHSYTPNDIANDTQRIQLALKDFKVFSAQHPQIENAMTLKKIESTLAILQARI